MPVEFDPYSYRIQQDPYPIYRQMRDEQPLYYNEQHDFWAVSRFEDCRETLKNVSMFSSASGTTLERNPIGYSDVMTSDPPDHTRLRNIMRLAFQPLKIAELEPMVRNAARSLLSRYATGGTLDVVQDFAGRLPMLVICRLLGYPPEDDDTIQAWTNTALHRDEGILDMPTAGVAAMASLARYNEEVFRRRAAEPLSDDLVSPLIGAMRDGLLTHSEAMGYLQVLSFAGHETTNKLIGNMIYQLWRHPDQLRLLQEDPALISAAIEETLRFDSSVHLQARTTTQDFDLHGRTVPAGARIGILFASANRDHRKYERAEEYDIRRNPRDHIAFGFGIHACLGAPLARLEAKVAIQELFALMVGYEIDESQLERVHSGNVRGFSRLPVTFTPIGA